MSWKNWMCGLAIFAAACGGNEEEAQQQANELAAQLEESMNMAAEQAAAEANMATAEANTAAAEGAAAANPGQGLEELGAALGAALEAAGMAEGGEPCEQAYNAMTAMVAALQKNMPAGGMQQPVPTRDQYLTACRQLPADAQQCSVPAYAMQNMETCQTIMQRPEVQQKMNELRALVQAGQ